MHAYVGESRELRACWVVADKYNKNQSSLLFRVTQVTFPNIGIDNYRKELVDLVLKDSSGDQKTPQNLQSYNDDYAKF